MERDGIEPSADTMQKYRSTKTELTPLDPSIKGYGDALKASPLGPYPNYSHSRPPFKNS